MKVIDNNNVLKQDNRLMMVSHRMGFNRLSRPADQRKALLRALTTEVIRHGKKFCIKLKVSQNIMIIIIIITDYYHC